MNFFVRPHFIALLLITLVAVGIERLIVTDAEAIEALGEYVATAMEIVTSRPWPASWMRSSSTAAGIGPRR